MPKGWMIARRYGDGNTKFHPKGKDANGPKGKFRGEGSLIGGGNSLRFLRGGSP